MSGGERGEIVAARSALTKSSSTTSSTTVTYASERHSSNQVKGYPSYMPEIAGRDGRASRVREGSETRRLTRRRKCQFKASLGSSLCDALRGALLSRASLLMSRDTASVHPCRETVDPQNVGSHVDVSSSPTSKKRVYQ